jgi:hypothetical protein
VAAAVGGAAESSALAGECGCGVRAGGGSGGWGGAGEASPARRGGGGCATQLVRRLSGIEV